MHHNALFNSPELCSIHSSGELKKHAFIQKLSYDRILESLLSAKYYDYYESIYMK